MGKNSHIHGGYPKHCALFLLNKEGWVSGVACSEGPSLLMVLSSEVRVTGSNCWIFGSVCFSLWASGIFILPWNLVLCSPPLSRMLKESQVLIMGGVQWARWWEGTGKGIGLRTEDPKWPGSLRECAHILGLFEIVEGSSGSSRFHAIWHRIYI